MLINNIMRDVIEQFIVNQFNSNVDENFEDSVKSNKLYNHKGNIHLFAMIVSLLLSQVLLLFFGKWLWNTCLVPTVSSINPLDNIWQLLGLSFLLRLIFK
jgi:hypothetical protein